MDLIKIYKEIIINYENIKKYKEEHNISKDLNTLDNKDVNNTIKMLNKNLLYKNVENNQLKDENVKLEMEIIRSNDELE